MTLPLEKIRRITKIDSGLAYVGLGNLVASILGGLFWLVLASMLAAEEYGRLNYYIAIAAVLSSISLLGLNTAVTTYLAKGFERLRYQAHLVVLVSNSIIFLLLLVFMKSIALSFLLLGLSFFMMSMAEILGRRLYRRYFFLFTGREACMVALAIGLYFVLGIDGIILGFAIATLIFSYRFFKSFRNFSISASELRPRFKFIMHSYSHFVSKALAIHADKLIVAPLFGFGVLGLYQLGFQFLMFLAIIPHSLFQYMLPQESSGVKTRKVGLLGFVSSIIIALTFFMASPLLISALFPNYVDSIPVAQIMSFGIIPMTIISILSSRFLAMEKSKPVFIGAAIYLGLLIPTLYVLGSIFGLLGLGIAVVLSLSAESILLWTMSRKSNYANQDNSDGKFTL